MGTCRKGTREYLHPLQHSRVLILGRSGDVYASETESILARTNELLPAVGASTTEILAVAAGLRPSREGGCRIESEVRTEGKLVVHNYGAGGTGYQAGMGMAMTAVDLASGALQQLKASSVL